MDDVRERVTALLPVVVEIKVTGEATILRLFDIDLKQEQTMKMAGCRIPEICTRIKEREHRL